MHKKRYDWFSVPSLDQLSVNHAQLTVLTMSIVHFAIEIHEFRYLTVKQQALEISNNNLKMTNKGQLKVSKIY